MKDLLILLYAKDIFFSGSFKNFNNFYFILGEQFLVEISLFKFPIKVKFKFSKIKN